MKTRQIKIKVWDKEAKKMLYPDTNGVITRDCGSRFLLSCTGRLAPIYLEKSYINELEPFLWTGITGENDVEVYEHDYCRVTDYLPYMQGNKEKYLDVEGIIVFKDAHYVMKDAIGQGDDIPLSVFNPTDIKVVGTVSENYEQKSDSHATIKYLTK